MVLAPTWNATSNPTMGIFSSGLCWPPNLTGSSVLTTNPKGNPFFWIFGVTSIFRKEFQFREKRVETDNPPPPLANVCWLRWMSWAVFQRLSYRSLSLIQSTGLWLWFLDGRGRMWCGRAQALPYRQIAEGIEAAIRKWAPDELGLEAVVKSWVGYIGLIWLGVFSSNVHL